MEAYLDEATRQSVVEHLMSCVPPKYRVGDRVLVKHVLAKLNEYDGKTATVRRVRPRWEEWDGARYVRRGLVIDSLTGVLPHVIRDEGHIVEIQWPEETKQFRFAGWDLSLDVDGLPYGLITADKNVRKL